MGYDHRFPYPNIHICGDYHIINKGKDKTTKTKGAKSNDISDYEIVSTRDPVIVHKNGRVTAHKFNNI